MPIRISPRFPPPPIRKTGSGLHPAWKIWTMLFVGFVLGLVDAPVESVESHIEKENEIEMNFKATLNFKNEIQGKVEGSINYNKERYALIKGEKGEIYVPMFNRVVEYTIHLENEVIQKTYPIEGDDMTLEIQALINHNQSTHTLQDSKKLQEMHIKDFHKNEESLYHEIFSPIKHQSEMDASAKDIGNDIKDYEWTHKWNNLVTFSSRNQMLDTYVIRIMEKRFIPMLVKYFPDQAGEVVKYIRKAGYGDGEVLDLIDRTAGYNSKTAYLYQGKSGEEHRKKLQRKQSGE